MGVTWEVVLQSLAAPCRHWGGAVEPATLCFGNQATGFAVVTPRGVLEVFARELPEVSLRHLCTLFKTQDGSALSAPLALVPHRSCIGLCGAILTLVEREMFNFRLYSLTYRNPSSSFIF